MKYLITLLILLFVSCATTFRTSDYGNPETLYMFAPVTGYPVHHCSTPIYYTIDNKVPRTIKEQMIKAFEYWDKFTNGKTFEFIGHSSNLTREELIESNIMFVEISNSLPSNILGATTVDYSLTGCINSVNIKISNKAFIEWPNLSWNVIRHEYGHALGFGHSDFGSDIMNAFMRPREGKREASIFELKALYLFY